MESPNVCVITIPINKAGVVPLSNLVEVLKPSINRIYVITGDSGYEYFKNNKGVQAAGVGKRGSGIIGNLISYIPVQLKTCYHLIRLSTKVDVCFFFIGGSVSLVPIIIAKILHKPVVLVYAGSDIQTIRSKNSHVAEVAKIVTNTSLSLFDKIIIYSPSITVHDNLEKYKNKITIAHKHFIDFDSFKISKPLLERENYIGYFGRLNEEKGIMNLIKAMQLIAEQRKYNIKLLIGGDGEQKETILKYIEQHNLSESAKYIGWIPHNRLSTY